MSVSGSHVVQNIQNWEYLSECSRNEYIELQKSIKKIINENAKSKFCSIFKDITGLIENYISNDSSDKHERSLICGYYFIGDYLAINTRQLMQLVSKCKSSINCGFQSLGYKVIPMTAEAAITLMKTFPFLKNQVALTRQWTLRSKTPYKEETESDIQTLLEKTLNMAPNVSLTHDEHDLDEIDAPSSASSSTFTTPQPEEKKNEIFFNFDSMESDTIENIEFFNEFDDCEYFDSNGVF